MRFPSTLGRCAALVAALLLGCAAAARAGFSAGLSPQERANAGLARLSPAQLAALDCLVDRDVKFAVEGGVSAFASSFTARCTPKEAAAAGIDRLSESERAFLDVLAARAIALGPPPEAAFSYAPAAAPAPQQTLVPAPARPQVHGDLSLTLGGGHGSSFYGVGADVFVTDPSGKYTLGVGVSQFHGKGFIGPYGPYCLLPDGPILPGW